MNEEAIGTGVSPVHPSLPRSLAGSPFSLLPVIYNDHRSSIDVAVSTAGRWLARQVNASEIPIQPEVPKRPERNSECSGLSPTWEWLFFRPSFLPSLFRWKECQGQG